MELPSSDLYNYILGEKKMAESVNHLTPEGDCHLPYPYCITSEQNVKVVKTKEMIAKWRSSWMFEKFSLSILQEIKTEKCGDYTF